MADGTFSANIARLLTQQNTFSHREVGVTHPDTPAFVRLTDNGDIQIMVDDALGIILNKDNNSITLMASTIRFVTTNNEGLAWNNNFFNTNATVYTQPTLNPATGANINNVFRGTEYFYNNQATSQTTSLATDQVSGFTNTSSATNPSKDLSTIPPQTNEGPIIPANPNRSN